MATTQISFGIVGQPVGREVPAMVAESVVSESITPSGSNQQTTIAARGGDPVLDERNTMARIATDTTVYVSFGSAPDAVNDANRLLIPAGGVEYLFVRPGYMAAVVTA